MTNNNDSLTVSRRGFLMSVGALGVLAAARGSIPLSMFSTNHFSGQSTNRLLLLGSQEMLVNLAGEPAQIDPNRASWAAERSVVSQVFEGLLGFDKNLAVIPVVAKELPTVANKGISSDGKTYTFNLNTNVTWSDGTKVLAKDFAYSIVRMLDPDLATEYASFYYPIAGAEAYNGAGTKTAAEKAALKAAVGVKATGDYTLQVTLGDAYPVFLQLMSLWPVYPVREDVITAKGDKWTEAGNYIGNGPFILTEWVHQDHMTFAQNPNYWGVKPTLTKITYKMITDANAALAAYKNGELDMSGVPVGTEKATMGDASLSPQIVRNADLTTFAFQFNVHVAPYDNLTLRKAISTAVDRASFVDKVRGGVGKVALSWIPPGMPGYDATLGTEYSFDVTKAKALLATALTELKLPDASKLALKFQFSDTASNKTVAQFLQSQMKDNLNIDLTLEPMESKAYSQLVNSNKHTWAWFGWGADYPDPDNWLPQLFGTGAGNNHTTYSKPEFDALCKTAGKELDNTKRLQQWADAQKMVMADAPIVTMFYRERFNLVKPYFKGLTPTGMDGQIMGDQFWKMVSIQKSSSQTTTSPPTTTIPPVTTTMISPVTTTIPSTTNTIPALTITTKSLPAGANGEWYSQFTSAIGGTLPYTWTIRSGALPSGLTLNTVDASTGVIVGRLADTGYHSFEVLVRDYEGRIAAAAFSITVNPAYIAPTAPTTTIPLVGPIEVATAAGGLVFMLLGGIFIARQRRAHAATEKLKAEIIDEINRATRGR